MRHIIPISGKDSLATALVQKAAHPDLSYEYVFTPTGLELPEVFTWIERVEEYLGSKINVVSNPLKPIIEEHNYFLPSGNARYCTRKSKIEPFVEWLGKDECMVYYGIRADEERDGFNNNAYPTITPVYPLQAMGINLKMVYLIVNNAGLKPPTFFWESLHNIVAIWVGRDPLEVLDEWEFDMLFAWRSRANCDRCFNQRQYEWIGLLEHYPDRFWEAESWEHKGGDKTYHWNNHKSLQEIYDQRDQLKTKRAQFVYNYIMRRRQTSFMDDESFFDVLSVKSCGLFCGK